MSIFYYHPQNKIPKQLREMTGKRGFTYISRGQLELTLQKQLLEAGHEIDMRFHTIISSLAGSIDYHIPLNPDDELDRYTLKICQQKAPWSYIKVLNGPQMMFIMGYVSSSGASPFAYTPTQLAQKGLLGVTHFPRPV